MAHPRRVMRSTLQALATNHCDRDTCAIARTREADWTKRHSPAACLLADTDTPEFPAVAGADTRNVMDFSGKHVFVVGGSRGIGASCVEMLARCGASVGFSFISNADAAADVEVRTAPVLWNCSRCSAFAWVWQCTQLN